MLPHQERVVIEKKELDDKIIKLDTFVTKSNTTFLSFPLEDQNLLAAQLDIMQKYSQILSDRINRF